MLRTLDVNVSHIKVINPRSQIDNDECISLTFPAPYTSLDHSFEFKIYSSWTTILSVVIWTDQEVCHHKQLIFCELEFVLCPVILMRALELLQGFLDGFWYGLRVVKMLLKLHQHIRHEARHIMWVGLHQGTQS